MGHQNNTSITDGEIMCTEGTKKERKKTRGIRKTQTNKNEREREREREREEKIR